MLLQSLDERSEARVLVPHLEENQGQDGVVRGTRPRSDRIRCKLQEALGKDVPLACDLCEQFPTLREGSFRLRRAQEKGSGGQKLLALQVDFAEVPKGFG